MEKEQIKDKLIELSGLREEKGKDEEALKMADEILKEGGMEPKLEAQVWLEKSLIWRHVFMNERNKGEGGDKERTEKAKGKMEEMIKTAEKVMKEGKVDRGDTDLRIDMFLGEVAMERGDYQGAKEAYKKAIEVVSNPTNRLEFKARLCETLIMLGKVKDGIRLAQITDEEFDTGVGEELKEKDYITWAIWKAGIWIRVARSLEEMDEEGEYKELIMSRLSEAEEYLDENKVESNKWLEKPFEIRLDQISVIKKKLV